MTLLDAAKGAAIVLTASTVRVALTVDEIVLLVVFPLLATWIGLAGIGVLEGQSSTYILRKFIGTFMLGGIAAIAALAVIDATDVRGYTAMFVTLCIGMAAMSVAKKLTAIGVVLLNPLWRLFGLQEDKVTESAMQTPQNLPPEMEEALRKLNEKE